MGERQQVVTSDKQRLALIAQEFLVQDGNVVGGFLEELHAHIGFFERMQHQANGVYTQFRVQPNWYHDDCVTAQQTLQEMRLVVEQCMEWFRLPDALISRQACLKPLFAVDSLISELLLLLSSFDEICMRRDILGIQAESVRSINLRISIHLKCQKKLLSLKERIELFLSALRDLQARLPFIRTIAL